jgi:hypothetical protein
MDILTAIRPSVAGAMIALTLVYVTPHALAEESTKFVGSQACAR